MNAPDNEMEEQDAKVGSLRVAVQGSMYCR